MKQNWRYDLIKILGTAVFLTAVFFAGRQAAVMVDSVVQHKKEQQGTEDRYKMQKYCVVVDAGHGGGILRKMKACFFREKREKL